MDEVRPGTFQWARATNYLAQCEEPFRKDIEPAMVWRLGPPLVAHALGLEGKTSLVIPWMGVLSLLGYIAWHLHRRSQNWRFTFAGTLMVASTSAAVVPLHWFGINDAWVWLGLLVVAFSPHRPAAVLAVLLTPWVDERFIIGLPLALVVGAIDADEERFRIDPWLLVALLPYAIARVALGGNPATNEIGQTFIAQHLSMSMTWIGLAPLGWWMGLRTAWVPMLYFISTLRPKGRLIVAAGFIPTVLVTIVLAADLSRSAAIALPLVIAGLTRIHNNHTELVNRYGMMFALVALLLPMAHIVGRKIDPVENILIEMARLCLN